MPRPPIEMEIMLKVKHIVPNKAWAHQVKLTEDEFKLWLDALGGTDKFQNYMDKIVPRLEADYNKMLKELKEEINE